MAERGAAEIGGYVLAGGRSSRMGRDKALLELGGKPLVEHAVAKLRRVCREVHILSNRLELRVFASLVPDLRDGCGPLAGIEAALLDSSYTWNLFLPVDMPFLPAALLGVLGGDLVVEKGIGARVAMFTVEGVTQPFPCLLDRTVGPYLAQALEERRFKVLAAIEDAATELAKKEALIAGEVFLKVICGENGLFLRDREFLTEPQRAARHLWFANLNTPEEFAEAERHLDALDT